MIKVAVNRLQDHILRFQVSGHALTAPAGSDLVCAGASSIVIGLLNAVDQMAPNDCCITKKGNNILIEVTNDCPKVQHILQTGLIQLETIKESFPKNIQITISED
jgi:uncharacterized protein YsxB (DUF464 family)